MNWTSSPATRRRKTHERLPPRRARGDAGNSSRNASSKRLTGMGEKGYVTQHSLLSTQTFNKIYTCGPKPMMMAVAKYAKTNNIECEVSLENTMACGFGVCLCCVENTTEGHICVCKEGPVFNIKKLLWQI